MSMFVGLRMDEASTKAIHDWLLRCKGLKNPLKEQFIYIPVCYSESCDLDPENFRSLVVGRISKKIRLENPKVQMLGKTGNVSLVFESEAIADRYKFWSNVNRRLKGKFPFKARIPMSHFCNTVNHSWLKELDVSEITLEEEFAIPFNRKKFLELVKSA